MHRSAVVFGLYLSFAIAVGAACGQPAAPETPGDDSFTPGQGGSNGGTGGGTGGTATGGTATGGTATGGTATGGTGGGTGGSTTGGAGGVSGMPGVGGAAMAGRANTVGGSAGTGGSVATGGSAGTASGTGGTGMNITCDAAFKVGSDGFVRMPAKDGSCWHGYAYGSGSTATTVSYCGDATAKDFTKCMGMLSITGTLEESIAPDYAGYVLVGFSVNEAIGGGTKSTVKPTGTSIVVNGTAAGGRVQLQAGTKYWCATFTSGTPIAYTKFNTACWDDSGDAYSTATPIDTIALQIPGGEAAAAYSITLTSVTEM